tara:strand:- start:194 stop:658 length:465 start_codon:yes stop_codon:yes gene_type:complete
MALSSKKYERMFSTTGSDADKIDTAAFNEIKKDFESNRYLEDVGYLKSLGPILYQIQLLTEELDALRSEISANKDKVGITTSQASAITANTAKTSMSLGTSSSTALAGDTKLVGIGPNTTLSFGDLTNPSEGTYQITLTAVNGRDSKSITLTLT